MIIIKRLILIICVFVSSLVTGCGLSSETIDYEDELSKLLIKPAVGFDKAYVEQGKGGEYKDILLVDFDRASMVVLSTHVKKSKARGNTRETEFSGVYLIKGNALEWNKVENNEITRNYHYSIISGESKLCEYSNDKKRLRIFDEINPSEYASSVVSYVRQKMKSSPKTAYYLLFPEEPLETENVSYSLEAVYQGSINPGTIIDSNTEDIKVFLNCSNGSSKEIKEWVLNGSYVLESNKTIEIPITYEEYETNMSVTGDLTTQEKYQTPGSIVYFGSYERDGNTDNGKEIIPWVVLYSDNDGALLISRYILEEKQFNSNKNGTSTCSWQTSDIRAWLNEYFYNEAFNDYEKSQLINIEVNDSSEITYDKVSLLESKFLNLLPEYLWKSTSATPYCKKKSDYTPYIYDDGNSSWWGIEGNDTTSDKKCNIYNDGEKGNLRANEHSGIRPVIKVDYSTISD